MVDAAGMFALTEAEGTGAPDELVAWPSSPVDTAVVPSEADGFGGLDPFELLMWALATRIALMMRRP